MECVSLCGTPCLCVLSASAIIDSSLHQLEIFLWRLISKQLHVHWECIWYIYLVMIVERKLVAKWVHAWFWSLQSLHGSQSTLIRDYTSTYVLPGNPNYTSVELCMGGDKTLDSTHTPYSSYSWCSVFFKTLDSTHTPYPLVFWTVANKPLTAKYTLCVYLKLYTCIYSTHFSISSIKIYTTHHIIDYFMAAVYVSTLRSVHVSAYSQPHTWFVGGGLHQMRQWQVCVYHMIDWQ